MTKESAIALQKIDCNCNDCKYLIRNIEQASTQKGKPAPIYQGECKQFNTTVTFMPGTCQISTQKCFVHRKD